MMDLVPASTYFAIFCYQNPDKSQILKLKTVTKGSVPKCMTKFLQTFKNKIRNKLEINFRTQ